MSLGEATTFCQFGKNLSQTVQATAVLNEFLEMFADAQKPIIVDLSDTQLNDASLDILAPIIQHSAVTELQLENIQLSPDGIIKLCQLLKDRRTPLQALSLERNMLGLGIYSIVALLNEKYPLQALALSSCAVQPKESALLAEALYNHPHLQRLRFNFNVLGEAIFEFANMIYHNKSLRYLELNSTMMDAEKAKLLGDALRTNQTLVSLNIECNDLNAAFSAYFHEKLIFNTRLSEYHGPDTQKSDIQAVCQRNQSLPANAPWSMHYNPTSTDSELSSQLINEIEVCNVNPTPSLLFLASQKALREKKLTGTTITYNGEVTQSCLAEQIYSSAYSEACAFKPKNRSITI